MSDNSEQPTFKPDSDKSWDELAPLNSELIERFDESLLNEATKLSLQIELTTQELEKIINADVKFITTGEYPEELEYTQVIQPIKSDTQPSPYQVFRKAIRAHYEENETPHPSALIREFNRWFNNFESDRPIDAELNDDHNTTPLALIVLPNRIFESKKIGDLEKVKLAKLLHKLIESRKELSEPGRTRA